MRQLLIFDFIDFIQLHSNWFLMAITLIDFCHLLPMFVDHIDQLKL